MTAIGSIDILILVPKIVGKVGGFLISQCYNTITGVFQREKPSDKAIEYYEQTVQHNAPKFVAAITKPQSYQGEIPDFNFNYNFTLQELLKDWVCSEAFSSAFLKGCTTMVGLYMAYKLLSKCREISPEEAVKIASSPDICTNGYYYHVELGGDQAD